MSLCTFQQFYIFKVGGFLDSKDTLAVYVERFDMKRRLWIKLSIDYH